MLSRDNYAIVLVVRAHGSRVGVDLTPTDAGDTVIRMVSEWQLEVDPARVSHVAKHLGITVDPAKLSNPTSVSVKPKGV